jgi:hypothetical protein
MPGYRRYFLDDAGHFKHVVEFDCHDDAQAIDTLEQHRDGRHMELWCRARFIRSFKMLES